MLAGPREAPAEAVGHRHRPPGRCLGEFRSLSKGPERPEVRRLLTQVVILGIALPVRWSRSSGTMLLLDQLGGIWEVIFWMALPKALPTGLKRASDMAFLKYRRR